MSENAHANWAYADAFIAEDDTLIAARATAKELGCVPIFPGGGTVLSVLAAAVDARHVCEIGSGAGISAVYLLRGMNPEGTLTSIDTRAENQHAALATVSEYGISAERLRMITGAALEVLPRLADEAYDLVFVDAVKSEYPDYVAHAIRLLRPGGLIVCDNMLWHSRVADPTQRDPDTTGIRETLKILRTDERLVSTLLPAADGLSVSVKRR